MQTQFGDRRGFAWTLERSHPTDAPALCSHSFEHKPCRICRPVLIRDDERPQHGRADRSSHVYRIPLVSCLDEPHMTG